DVYLPDIKYFDDRYAVKYSGAPGYFASASGAVREMVDQLGGGGGGTGRRRIDAQGSAYTAPDDPGAAF
ncbi:MAG: hypothetical protein M1609_05490, partial [Firmicutes bacterium]|nr:hypothetical protein [Bacillota bacterium]